MIPSVIISVIGHRCNPYCAPMPEWLSITLVIFTAVCVLTAIGLTVHAVGEEFGWWAWLGRMFRK